MMHDYYSFYTWAKDRQAQLEREAAERRMLQEWRHAHVHTRIRLPWPLTGRRRNGR